MTTATTGAPPNAPRPAAALSCYTTALHDYRVELGDPLDLDVSRIALRASSSDAGLEFSHHGWWGDVAGGRLEYRATDSPSEVGPALLEEVARNGCALAVVNTDAVDWSVTPGAVPHWLVVRDTGVPDALEVVDSFAALLPAGEQHPHRGLLGIDELVAMMRLPAEIPDWVRARDRFALGAAGVDVPEGRYRWLGRGDLGPGSCAVPEPATEGWTTTTAETLTLLADVLPDRPELLSRHVEDLWAAARHRVAGLERRSGPGQADPSDRNAPLREAWQALPRSLRFCADSADRGRPRAAVARRSLVHLAGLERDNHTHLTSKETT